MWKRRTPGSSAFVVRNFKPGDTMDTKVEAGDEVCLHLDDGVRVLLVMARGKMRDRAHARCHSNEISLYPCRSGNPGSRIR